MKSTGPERQPRGLLPRLVAALCCLVLAACAIGATPPATPQRMDDPLFGISYDTAAVKFERLPAATARAAELGTQPQWIYARSGEISVVAGFLPVMSDEEDSKVISVEPDFGAVLRGTGAGVKVLGVPDGLFGDPPLVSEAELAPLLADAVQRYIKAWGGKEKLQQALRDFDDPSIVPAPLRAALQAQGLSVGAQK
jgi:hypothetical protein